VVTDVAKYDPIAEAQVLRKALDRLEAKRAKAEAWYAEARSLIESRASDAALRVLEAAKDESGGVSGR
jgi:Arc/MetJ-type ribon-helix-helix transcriptional regulator